MNEKGFNMTEEELAERTADAVNHFGFDNEKFCEVMHRQHRTLQQNFMRLVLEYIRSTAEQEYYDDRNEASVNAAKLLKEKIDDIYLPYI